MKTDKEELYRVRSSKFIGGDEEKGYTYEICFNRSLEHTGKFSGIADGLNEYDRKERASNLKESLADSVALFWIWLKGLFQRRK